MVPGSLVEAGFREAGDLWAPWCIALVDGQVASIAQTVRTGPGGAEVGVNTAIGFRGLGLGAATTASWSAHPDLKRWTLFYGTGRDNRSSQRVAARLGLRFIGSTFAVP
jgi:predicted GNAT family acetyltransferase